MSGQSVQAILRSQEHGHRNSC